MVRDAQRSARDTEILVTIVRAAAEMRNSFDDIKRMLADTEDVIITEVKDNTDRSMQKAINGPRPYPGSAARSLQGNSLAATSTNGEDLPTKRRNIFRRALKGLSSKGTNDLGRIEDMLNQLLSEVDVLKSQTAQPSVNTSNQDAHSFDHVQPEVDEQDHGYEPEGHAGTSTASHASQSGHLSIPQSRGTSAKLGYDRKVSAHRISTVPEANEDEYDRGPELEEQALINETGGNHEQRHLLRTPARDQRGSSVPLDTPPQATAPAQGSLSNENTPRTDGGKKKTGGRTSWFPKISRWSETTTSSVAQAFRRSGQSRKAEDETQCRSGASRSGSIDGRSVGPGSIATYSDNLQYSDPYRNPSRELFSSDQPHTGFSQPDLEHSGTDAPAAAMASGSEYQPPMASVQGYANATPEDPKYKVHRDSLNLQHPQPRPGQTERFRANLESQALGFDSTMGPRSTEWAGSATSLHRFPRNPDRDSYNSATDQIRDAHAHQQQHWTSPPGSANMAAASSGPPIPPKEPIDRHATGADSPSGMLTRGTPPRSNRTSNLQKQSPQPRPSVESGYGTMMHGVPTASYVSHSREGFSSPKIENRNLSAALGVPARRPTGPRAMTPKSAGGEDGGDGSERRRKRGL